MCSLMAPDFTAFPLFLTISIGWIYDDDIKDTLEEAKDPDL